MNCVAGARVLVHMCTCCLPVLSEGVFTLLSHGEHSTGVQVKDRHRWWVSLCFGCRGGRGKSKTSILQIILMDYGIPQR